MSPGKKIYGRLRGGYQISLSHTSTRHSSRTQVSLQSRVRSVVLASQTYCCRNTKHSLTTQIPKNIFLNISCDPFSATGHWIYPVAVVGWCSCCVPQCDLNFTAHASSIAMVGNKRRVTAASPDSASSGLKRRKITVSNSLS
jgi:hypothetical protein